MKKQDSGHAIDYCLELLHERQALTKLNGSSLAPPLAND
jgi:hypothetical protein